MPGLTERLAAAACRRPKRVLAIWGTVLLLALATVAVVLPTVLTSDSDVTTRTESKTGYRLLDERFPPSNDYVDELVVVHSPTLRTVSPAFRRKVEQVAGAISGTGAVVNVRDYLTSDDPRLVSPDRHATVVAIGLGPDADGNIGGVIDVVRAQSGGGFDVTITGNSTGDHDTNALSAHDLQQGELLVGLPAALVVLVLVFGAVVAAALPVLLALVSIVIALGLTAIVGQFADLSVYVVNMVFGMGLALGIDYSLFVVSRFREERRHGRVTEAAIRVSGASASRAILVSGLAFTLAMFGMVLVPDTILKSLAVGAILVGLTSVAAALTLLPALLALLGDRVNAVRVPWLGRRVERSAGSEGRVWSAVARAVMHRPVVSLVASVALLVALALPARDLVTGEPGVRSIPDNYPSKQGFLALERSFGVGTADSVQVVVDGKLAQPPVRAAVRRLADALRADPRFEPPTISTSPGNDLAELESLVVGDSRDERTIQAVEHLRHVTVPAALAGTDARAYVTGETAEVIDYSNMALRWRPRVFAFVLGLSFVLLLLAFRSIVVPVKAILLNLLSISAAYGTIVLVFEKGVGNELFGFTKVDVVASWLPLFLFSVLFGLSMDYHVFLLSRIRERYLQSGDNTGAVAYAIGSTSRLITGAALIIIAVFSGFASGDLVEFQEMGFGVAVALLLDATVVRSVLLPASMKLLGDWNWYLPRRLAWLPHLEVEGRVADEHVPTSPSVPA